METSIDHAEVGLIAGLDEHQQLLTDQKRPCRCPANRYATTRDGEVLRHMRPTLSELGACDGTALIECKTKKNVIYLLDQTNVGTYEIDEAPPFLANQQAVDVAIEPCLMLNCDTVDEVHIARQQCLDGSIPTGFQRTAIAAANGCASRHPRAGPDRSHKAWQPYSVGSIATRAGTTETSSFERCWTGT